MKNIKCIKNLSIKKLGRNSDGMSERLLEDDEDDEDSDYVCKRLVWPTGVSEERVTDLFNPLNTKLSCWNFNLVNADQFSRE